MEQLLDFIFSNIYFVIIVIGLIYSMFFRKSSLEKPDGRPGGRPGGRPESRSGSQQGRRTVRRQTPAGRMPDFGGSPVFPPKPVRGREQRPETVWTESQEPSSAERRQTQPVFVERRQPQPMTVEGRQPQPEFLGRDPGYKESVPDPVYTLTGQTDSFDMQVNRDAMPADNVTSDSAYTSAAKTAAPAPAAAAAPAVTQAPGISLSGDDLARAVIWAEIIGPPRARRPYRK